MSLFSRFVSGVAVTFLTFQLGSRVLYSLSEVSPPAVNYEYHWRLLDNIWSPKQLSALLDMVEGFGTIPSATRDQTYENEEIGEAEPIRADKTCDNLLLVPNRDYTKCVLPGRFDIAQHYITFGGHAGLKEKYENLVARMLSFNKFFFDVEGTLTKVPELKALFEAPGYLENSATVCDLGTKNPVLDPFQLGIILQLPGQSVPMHLDAPYFWGASRFSLPIWLVVVMQFSGLWEDKRIHQVQGVAYLHDWGNTTARNGGGFFFYPGKNERDSALVVPAERNTGIVCDGAIQTHGTELYTPHGAPGKVLPLSQHTENELVFDKANKVWEVRADKALLGTFKSSELRIALVWRARCFRDENERSQFHSVLKNPSKNLSVKEVLDTLEKDLRARGRLTGETPRGIPMAKLLLKEYLRYPASPFAKMPYNYCALPSLYPWTKSIIDMIC